MRLLTLVFVFVLLAAGLAQGQAGTIILSVDEAGNDCNLQDRSAGMCSYFVVHVSTSGAQASSFSATAPSCFSGTWLSDTAHFAVTLGDSQNGVSIAYGECLTSPIQLLTINFFCQGLTESCCSYKVYPHPDVTSGEIEVVDCSLNTVFGTGGRAVVNPDSGCECGPPTQDSTWGKVKTLYGR